MTSFSDRDQAGQERLRVGFPSIIEGDAPHPTVRDVVPHWIAIIHTVQELQPKEPSKKAGTKKINTE